MAPWYKLIELSSVEDGILLLHDKLLAQIQRTQKEMGRFREKASKGKPASNPSIWSSYKLKHLKLIKRYNIKQELKSNVSR